jgi:tetratricopeptide (TPR) repeat protein/serine/threonine protein kinase
MTAPSRSLKELFLAALEVAPADRAAWLERECAGDAALREHLGLMLAAHDAPQSLLDRPAGAAPLAGGAPPEGLGPTIDEPLAEAPGTVIGPYKLVEPIGEGGMGAVWMAQQTEPVKRLVALKVIKPGMDSKQVLARFAAERQALALMDHPNIAKVLDAAATPTGRPYFVMELVKGVPLTRYCDQHRLTPRQRLELFIPVCQAIQHAHQKGIIHRDIKPSNVLVALYDGKPVPKVIDFGIAKATGQQLTERTLLTGFGAVVGTLEYMSPEQAELNQLDIDTRSDIYSLGVLLYELLTGTTPLDRKRLKEAALLEVLRVIREEEPPRPSTRLSTTEELPSVAANRGLEPKKLSGVVRGELDWIVMKALEKDRNRRYETANGFAMDVQRYLADEPVQACPPSAWYRLRKFMRRNRTALAVTGLAVFFITALGGGGIWVALDRTARQQRLTVRVEQILGDVDRLERDQKWPEALAAAGRAEEVLASGEADDATRRRVRDVKHGLAFVAELDRIRQERAASVNGQFNHAGASRDYAKAFRDYGMDMESLPVEEASARLRGNSALAAPVAAALDDWVEARHALGEGKPNWERLVAVARGIDPDPVRDRLRSMWGERMTPGLRAEARRLAESIDIQSQSPQTLDILAKTLAQAQLPDAAVQILRDSRYAHPGDFWVNFDLGYQLSESKDHVGAVRYYSAAVSVRPDSSAAHNNLGIALTGQGNLDEAIAEYRKAIELDPKCAPPHINLGEALRRQGKLDEAVAENRKAIALDSKVAGAHNNLGIALSEQGKLDEAFAEWRQAIALDRKLANPHMNLGQALALSEPGKLDEAVAECRQAVALDPKDAKAHYSLGIALHAQKKLTEAVAEFRKAIALDPKYAKAHSNLGVTLHAQKKLTEAVAECRQAITLDPKLAPAHHGLGIALHAQKKLTEAVAEFRQAIALDPKDAKAHYNLGIALHDQGDVAGALAEFRQAIALDPKDAKAHYSLGAALYRQGKLDEAIARYRKAIDLDPMHVAAHDALGTALRDEKQLDEAIREYHKAIGLDPNWAPAHNNLGIALSAQGKLDEAIAEYRTAVKLDPQDAMAQVSLGNALREQGQLDEAVAACRHAIDLDPKCAPAHNNLGAALYEQRKLDLAITALRKAIELNPKFALPYSNLGKVLRDQKKLEEAVTALGKAIELDPTDAQFHVSLGAFLCDHKHDYDGAIAELEKAIALDPKSAPAYDNLGIALWGKGNLDGAVTAFRKVIALDPKCAPAYCNLGVALRAQGKLDESIGCYRRAIQLDPKRASTHRYLGYVLVAKCQFDEAIAAYREAIRLDQGYALAHNDLAWVLATCPNVTSRDAGLAVELAKKAVQLAPKESNYWGTLGTAHYRAGNWKEAVAALDKSRELQQRCNAYTWLFLAMAHRKLGNDAQARKCYDQAVEWLEQNRQMLATDTMQAEELRRFRSEAEEVLELKKK